jgi:hypothetical protein
MVRRQKTRKPDMQRTDLEGRPVSANQFLELVENWDGPRNEYWIAVNALSATLRHNGQILIGPESKTIGELEKIAAGLRADLELVLTEAREKIAQHNKS